jgi:hypothetical protein
MLHDAYADDNCWLLAIRIGDSLSDFLASGWVELRRVPQGVFYYFYLLPYRHVGEPFAIWHTVSLATEIVTALILYKLARNLCGDAWLAMLVAGALIVVPLDHVVPYVSSANYRLGTLFGLASLYLTDEAARESKWGWRIPAALILAAVAEHVMTEAAIGLEPARLLLVWNRLHRPQRSLDTTVRVVKWLTPFALIGLALVAYKLAFKPYGIYAGMYSTGFSNLLDRDAFQSAKRLFTLGLWRLLRYQASYAQLATIILAVLAAAMALTSLFAFRAGDSALRQNGQGVPRSAHLFLVSLGVAILLPTLFIFFYGGRPPRLGTDSNHATIMQPGYALIAGAIVHWIAMRAYLHRRHYFIVVALGLAFVAGAGVFYNNLNLDLFKVASIRQDQFWSAFKKRFPAPPPRTDFVIDAEPPPYGAGLATFFQFEDIHSSYELELGLNRLYAPASLTGTRRYRVYPFEEMMADFRSKGDPMFQHKLVRTTHFGTDSLDFGEMTYVYWRGGPVLVNREILAEKPNVVYRELADKPPPAWAAPLVN